MVISITTNSTSVTATATSTFNITSGNLRFYIVAIEQVVGANKYVVRKIFPDASGVPIALPFNTNKPVSVTVPWAIESDKINNPAQLSVIAFVQDLDTRLVLQAAYPTQPVGTPSVVAGLEPLAPDQVATFPIPSDKEFTIELHQPAQQSIVIRLVNQLGQPVVVDAFAQGQQRKSVGTQQLAEGLYILQLGDNGIVSRKKVIVVH
jgi:hypothetical protein